MKRHRSKSHSPHTSGPLVLSPSAWRALSPAALGSAYRKHNCVLLRGYVADVAKRWRGVGAVAPFLAVQRESCVERAGTTSAARPAKAHLSAELRCGDPSSWYVSFAAQPESGAAAYSALVDALPLAQPSATPAFLASAHIPHHACVWWFVGRHDVGRGAASLSGRAEHTDAITHSGTWHLQLSGAKTWRVRRAEMKRLDPSTKPERLLCRAGDLLLVNTRCWAHQTEIPSTAAARDGLSISAARDFTLPLADGDASDAQRRRGRSASASASGTAGEDGTTDAAAREEVGGSEGDLSGSGTMSNLQPLVAIALVERGAVIYALEEMPECHMVYHRTPSCEVAMAPDGRVSLVALRRIEPGEWLTLLEEEEEEEEEG